MDVDVAIVGAGPAGASAALRLVEAGLRVVVLERAAMPRYKTCGGGLLARGLTALPPDFVVPTERACLRAELRHHGPALRFVTQRTSPIVTMVMRDVFDHRLAQAAESRGARVSVGTPVRAVAQARDGVEIKTDAQTLTARFVIGADGVNSVVARGTGFAEIPWVAAAVEAEIKVEPERFAGTSDTARFDFGLTPYGYGWVFPKREHLSVGVLTVRKGSCNLNLEYSRYLATVGLAHPQSEERHGYIIPIAPRPRLFAVPRVLLAGDAAGLADPVTAEGISGAIVSGRKAADAIIYGGDDPARVAERYRAALRDRLSELAIARKLAYVLYNCPRLRGAVLARKGQALAEFATDVVTGKTSYRRAMRSPRSWWKLCVQ